MALRRMTVRGAPAETEARQTRARLPPAAPAAAARQAAHRSLVPVAIPRRAWVETDKQEARRALVVEPTLAREALSAERAAPAERLQTPSPKWT